MKSWLPVLALSLSAMLVAQREARGGVTRAERASALFASASRRIAQGTHEQRQLALVELQDAAKLDATRSDIALALGRLYLEGDFLSRARDVVRRLTAGDPANASGWLLEGQVWRRTWLATVDPTARDRAILCLARCGRLAPHESGTGVLLAPLLVDAGEPQAAYEVAASAARAAPADAEAQVQWAAAAQRMGEVATADRLFRANVPRLPANLRERYVDIGPLLPPWLAERYATFEAAERERFIERFWAGQDPDPVSVENEARLEYWTRVTQAVSLYGASVPGYWDARAQYYVRFGQPAFEELNPIDKPERLRDGDWLAWSYPDLGLRVWMGTRSTFNGFSRPVSTSALWARAWPESLARHTELSALYEGWAVLHRLPPGVSAMRTGLALAQFESDAGTSVLAQAEAPGGIEDDMTVDWVVVDSTGAAVMRHRQAMSASACRADEARATSLTTTLTPGRYSVGVRVSDASGRLGIVRRDVVVPAASRQLALSDLVVTCGPPTHSVVPGSGVRLEPDTGLFPAEGDQLNAYVEIYHLARAENGEAQFEYECSVRSAARDPRGWLSRLLAPRDGPQPIEMSRAETTRGSLRRQFLSVPVGSLPTGSYQIAVLVRDVTNGASAKAVASFERRH